MMLVTSVLCMLAAACARAGTRLQQPLPLQAAPVQVGTAEHLLLGGDSALTANTSLVPKTHPPVKTGNMVVVPDKP